MADKRVSVGGQAVIEGVMMRSPTHYATAVRTPQGRIVIQKNRFVATTHRFRFLNVPVLRGAINLVETLWIGVKSLMYSAEQAMDEPEGGRKPRASWRQTLAILGSVAGAFGAGFVLFFLLPLWLAERLGVQSGVWFNLVDGALRLVVFLGYIFAIARWGEIQRVFQYHGAEHKTIHAFESGQDVTVDSVRPWTTLHPRCGTSFLIVVMLTSIVVFAFLGRPQDWGDRLVRFSMIPLIGGISYEFIRLSAHPRLVRWMRPLTWPGLALQKVTTSEPTDDMIEVAIAALDACLDYQDVRLEMPAA